MKKYLFKPSLFIFIILITLLATGFVFGNFFLIRSQDALKAKIRSRLSQELSTARIYYLPPDRIIIKKISTSDTQIKNKQLCSIKSATLIFSLRQLLLKKEFLFTKIYIDELDLKPVFFARDNIQRIVELLQTLEIRACQIKIKNALFPLPQQYTKDKLALSGSLKIDRHNNIKSSGSAIIKTPKKSKFLPINYALLGHVTKSGIDIKALEFKRKNFLYSNLRGKLGNNVLKLQGFLFADEVPEDYYLKGSKTVIARILKGIRRTSNKNYVSTARSSQAKLNIFDLDCLIKFHPEEIHVEKINCSINNIPLSLKGKIFFQNDLEQIDFQLSSYPSKALERHLENIRKFNLKISGFMEDRRFSGNAKLAFLRRSDGKSFLDAVSANFNNLAIILLPEERLSILFEQSKMAYNCENKTYEVALSGFDGLIDLKNSKHKFFQFKSMIYDGHLNGKGVINVGESPIKSYLNLGIDDVDANKMSSLLIDFSQIYGRLGADVHYTASPQMDIAGKILITDGYAYEVSFFKWLAGFFNIPRLSRIKFKSLSADFLVSKEISHLKNIWLQSNDVKLSGYFNLSADDLVKSKLSLDLSRRLLATSPQFKRLLKILGEDIDSLMFDFKLSGIYGATNFSWLESDLKARIQDIIPGGMQKSLESEIEKAIEAIAADN